MPMALPIQVIPSLLSRATHDDSEQRQQLTSALLLQLLIASRQEISTSSYSSHNRRSHACFRPTLTPDQFSEEGNAPPVRVLAPTKAGGERRGGGRHRQAHGGRLPCGGARGLGRPRDRWSGSAGNG